MRFGALLAGDVDDVPDEGEELNVRAVLLDTAADAAGVRLSIASHDARLTRSR